MAESDRPIEPKRPNPSEPTTKAAALDAYINEIASRLEGLQALMTESAADISSTDIERALAASSEVVTRWHTVLSATNDAIEAARAAESPQDAFNMLALLARVTELELGAIRTQMNVLSRIVAGQRHKSL